VAARAAQRRAARGEGMGGDGVAAEFYEYLVRCSGLFLLSTWPYRKLYFHSKDCGGVRLCPVLLGS
jgi:hypothetical protein